MDHLSRGDPSSLAKTQSCLQQDLASKLFIQLHDWLNQPSKWCVSECLLKSSHILRKAFATNSKLSIRTWNLCVRSIDVCWAKYSFTNFVVVKASLLAEIIYAVEVSDLQCTKHIVCIFHHLSFFWAHDDMLLAREYLFEKLNMLWSSSEYHWLPLEVFKISAFSQELWHVIHNFSSLLWQHCWSSRKDCCANPDWSLVWKTSNNAFKNLCVVVS